LAGAPFYIAPAEIDRMDGEALRFWGELAVERFKEDSNHGNARS